MINASKEYQVKISKRPEIEGRVKLEEEKLAPKLRKTDPVGLNLLARSHIANQIIKKRANEKKEELKGLTMVDPLTGLYNRRWLSGEKNADGEQIRYGELDIKIATAKRIDNNLWLFYLDLDNFKPTNDQYGHKVADKILESFRILAIRKEEPMARIGGEEFVQIVDENIKEEDVSEIMSRHMERLEEIGERILNGKPTKLEEGEIPIKTVTISFGAAKYIPGETAYEFEARAERAMREAKAQGKNKGFIDKGKGEYKEIERQVKQAA